MTNTYLAGFQTLDRETSGAELDWQGTPPVWLNGVLLRTGPAKFEARAAAYRHWFDGLAMLHRFSFGGDTPIAFCEAARILIRLCVIPLSTINL